MLAPTGNAQPLRNTARRLQDATPSPDCNPVTVDFTTAANGTPLAGGIYVENEWIDYGMMLMASGGVGTLPRLLDSANPRGPNASGGDPDLGSPNESCPVPGPGIGEGGAFGEVGENCEFLGNVLIIQEPNESPEIPDDNRDGGTINFIFPIGVYVFEIGLLDVDDTITSTVQYGSAFSTREIPAPLLGKNSYQTVPIMTDDVNVIECAFEGSGAVTHIKFCPVLPTTEAPTPTPHSTCSHAKISFEYSAKGVKLQGGEYLQNEWIEYGLSLSASGGKGLLPRLFDTSVYRDPSEQDGDADLGSPNRACRPPGPGSGDGGAPGKEGENCEPLGNVLIVQEEGVEVPDDSGTGGEIVFDFSIQATTVDEMGFLDIEDETRVVVTHLTKQGDQMETVFDLPLLGDNSKQTLEIYLEHVTEIRVVMSKSGAVTFVSFCYFEEIQTGPPAIGPPAAVPTSLPTAVPTPLPSAGPTTSRTTAAPTSSPTANPSPSPTVAPSANPTRDPTASPTMTLTASPSASPTGAPTAAPTRNPTLSPTAMPTTANATDSPTASPTGSPTDAPTSSSTQALTPPPTAGPTLAPSALPSTSSPTKSPTASPMSSPTASPPTRVPTVAMPSKAPLEPTTPRTCTGGEVMIDFQVDANGSPLSPGLYVENEWSKYGLTLSAMGGLTERPRLFDTANPWIEDTGGDRDLGSPNWRCSPPGPGRGAGGEPGEPGENCEPLGNVLIIQEEDAPIPDDNFQGGMIVFDFAEPVKYVSAMGFLDVDEEAVTLTVSHMVEEGMTTTVLPVPQLGDNSKQTLDIGIENVIQMKLVLKRSGAVTFLSFCPDTGSPPELSPYILDFETAADGSSIPPGAYLELEWEEIGVSLSATGGFGSLPRVFDTENPGNSTSLGSPNQRCSPQGPGIGEGGESDTQGDNCKPLGNVLIVEAVGDPSIIMPSKEAVMIEFEFMPVAPRVYDIGLLNIDGNASISAVYTTGEGVFGEQTFDVVALGPNSYQTLNINLPNVRMLTVSIENGGAVAFVSFDSPPMQAPVDVPTATLPPIDMSMSMMMSMSMPIAPIPFPTAATTPSFPTMPPTSTEPSKAQTSPPFTLETVTEILSRDNRFSTLVALMNQVSLLPALEQETRLTLFAPTNQAFESLGLPSDTPPEILSEVLLNHVVRGDVPIENAIFATALSGAELFLTATPTEFKVNGADIDQTISASDGSVIVIQSVLISPTDKPTIAPIGTTPNGPSPSLAPITETPITPTPVTEAPTRRVTAEPSRAPVEPPIQLSPIDAIVGFDVTPNGEMIPEGAYLEFEWAEYGLTLSASGGFGTLPRAVDSTNPGGDAFDLGSPNERCPFIGPGIGEGGEPDSDGENCNTLGNVIVVQDPTSDTPDDNEGGGTITFEFEPLVPIVYELELLNVNAATTITASYKSADGTNQKRTINASILGVNSYQKVPINIESVSMLEVAFVGTGAVASVSFAYLPQEPESPSPIPVETQPPAGFPTQMSMSMPSDFSMSMP